MVQQVRGGNDVVRRFPVSAGLDRTMIGVAHLDLALVVRQANDEFVAQCRAGRGPREVYGRGIAELVDAELRLPLQRGLRRLVHGEADRFVAPLPNAHGPTAGELTGTPVRDATNQVAGVTVLVRVDPIPGPRTSAEADRPILSAVHARILEGIAVGASTAQLAAQLNLSRQGVEYHITALLRKLTVSNRAALVSKAHALGVLRLDVWPPTAVSEAIHR